MDLIVSAVFGTLIQNVVDFISEKTTAMLGLEGELERLHRRLAFVETLISHAEIRSFKDSSASNWLNLLRDFAYDAEDIIDSCRSWSQGENSLLEDREQSSSSSSDVLVSGKLSILSWFKNARFRSRINAQIEKLNDRLNDICDDKLVSTLELTKPNEHVGVTAVNWRQTCPLVEPDIVGEEITIATKELVEVIVGFTEKMIRIVGIVGMGGIGKTTLAQKVYNDPKISGNFEHQMWVCVSQNYSEIDLLKQIIRAFRVDCRMGETTGELQCVLSSAIYGKSFFLVLDDVWQSDVWTSLLKTPLRNAINGIIVITTRDRNILVRLQAAYIHQVKKMSRNSGWELLCKSSYISSDEAKSLENIGMQIVNKCDFLPLAIKAIGGVLTTKNKTERDWGNLLSNDVWSIKDLPDVIGGALYLSYRDLPSNLKQCFLFICLYPEDAAMSRTDLIRFWVAAGFVKSQKDKLLEEIAEEYYYELSWPVLPPLGQLPSLKILKIIGSNSIVKIGSEFLNYHVRGMIIVKIPFPKLEILQIEEMPNLEEWCLKTEENKKGDIYFPSLKKLNVINCPKLGAMPQELKHAKNLKEVFIKGVLCIMEISLNPYCDGLHIENCRGLERIGDHPKTTRVNIFLCPALRCVQNFDALVELRVAYDLLNAYAPWLPELIDRQNLLHGDNFRVYYFRVEHSS
ncbi:hypothetical protein LUZ60_016518 [Juncus effusus]|nr:hypothetical protein LUZ60_016518 [Juncus effusus]